MGYSEHDGQSTTQVSRSIEQRGNDSPSRTNAGSESQGPSERDVADSFQSRLEGWVSRSLQKCPGEQSTGPSSTLSDATSGRRSQRDTDIREQTESGSVCWRVKGTGITQPGLGDLADGFPIWLAEPDGIPRVATGVKDRVNKLRALGNAVVPQQIYQVYKAIVEVEANQ